MAAALATFAIGLASAHADRRVHVVGEGDTLWEIARASGCDLGALQAANELGDNLLRVGQELVVPRCEGGAPPAASATPAPAALGGGLRRHVVASGDTLYELAKLYDSSVADLRARNGLRGNVIYAGQELLVLPGSGGSGAPIPGQSIGRPQAGRLRNATRLPPGPGYYIRRPQRAFGTNYAVHHIQRAVDRVRRRYPGLHRLAIGDLSAQGGGPITMHASHQSGRDADLGFYFRRRPRGYPEEFVVANRANLHFEATWALLVALAETADAPAGVERIFLSYETQGLLYRLAREKGVPRARLDALFQYPHGRGAARGLVRHEPAHDEHFHVRFKCPPGDRGCN